MLMMRRAAPRGVQTTTTMRADVSVFAISLSVILGGGRGACEHFASTGKVQAAFGHGFVPLVAVEFNFHRFIVHRINTTWKARPWLILALASVRLKNALAFHRRRKCLTASLATHPTLPWRLCFPVGKDARSQAVDGSRQAMRSNGKRLFSARGRRARSLQCGQRRCAAAAAHHRNALRQRVSQRGVTRPSPANTPETAPPPAGAAGPAPPWPPKSLPCYHNRSACHCTGKRKRPHAGSAGRWRR